MCGIAGAISLTDSLIPGLRQRLTLMNELVRHRGPDGEGIWEHGSERVGLAHSRLAIIDLATGDQPMTDQRGNWVSYNGEVYNYRELRAELGRDRFRTTSDTEVILEGYQAWGEGCVDHFRGMFAFALWDEQNSTLFCARDRFGIKPFYYATADGVLYFASEIKAILPFLPGIETDLEGLKDYLAFQFCLQGKTMFRGVKELPPGHVLVVKNGSIAVRRYWEVYFDIDWEHTERYFIHELRERLLESAMLHLRSDVPLGGYLSGGLDSSIVSAIAARQHEGDFIGFTGRFHEGPQYDESRFAQMVADENGFQLDVLTVTAEDFIDNVRSVIYHLDFPVAGPGAFSQYMVSRMAAEKRKVVLGGQGGDEIFGGYTRYLIAYFEQVLKAAIDGTMRDGKFVVTYESIIPNLRALAQYKPLLKEFWREGLFDEMDKRYFRLVNRAPHLGDEVRWDALGDYSPYESFRELFNADNVGKLSYFDSMTHFDFKTLLPALLQVEDRVSMAHGLESRVPMLDHAVVELAATIPADVKFKAGEMKRVLKVAMRDFIPADILARRDKMGFPTPLTEWVQGEARDFVLDVLTSEAALSRELIDNRLVADKIDSETGFGRTIWGLLCLELWHQEFHDRAREIRASWSRLG